MTLTIDIISDVVCPWCFIGKRRLEAALANLRAEQPGLTIDICWRPYFLNPETPPEGDDYRSFLERKFGGPEALQAIWERVADAGRSALIEFAFDKIRIRPNTLRAHRLIHHAQNAHAERGEAWVEALFKAHFQDGRDIGDLDTLCAIAGELGDDPQAVRRYLESDADVDTVNAHVERAQGMGISGVPFFIFNGKLAVSGAHPPEVLRQAIEEAMA